MVKNTPSSVGNLGSIPGWGTKIPHAAEQLSLSTAIREPAIKNPCSQNFEKRKESRMCFTDSRCFHLSHLQMLNTQWPCYQVGKGVFTCVVCQNLGGGVGILQEIEWVLSSKSIEQLRDVESLTAHWERGRALGSHLFPPHLLPLQFTVHFTLRKQIQNFLNFCTALWGCEGLAMRSRWGVVEMGEAVTDTFCPRAAKG